MKKAVLVFLCGLMIAIPCTTIHASGYALQDSVWYENWHIGHMRYNCYSYALGDTKTLHIPGEMSGNSYNKNMTLDEVKNLVVRDLKSYHGYGCVYVTKTRPASQEMGDTVIALRIDPGKDFHFMRLFGTVWRHKPGDSAVLTYKYLPSVGRTWISEGITSQGPRAGSSEYTGDIYYFVYRYNHKSAGVRTGSGFHEGNQHYYETRFSCCQTVEWPAVYCDGSCGDS